MAIIPIERMKQRVALARSDSDAELFRTLIYYGELVTKLIILPMAAAIGDDKDRLRYRAQHQLVRADGIGTWPEVLDEILKGPSSQFLSPSARIEQRELTKKLDSSHWQHQSVTLLAKCLTRIGKTSEEIPLRVDARSWFKLFANFRNKTISHGAPKISKISSICKDLEKSIEMICENFPLFKREWVYLHRNLSGKYRVSPISDKAGHYEALKKERHHSFENGVYVLFDTGTLVNEIHSDPDLLESVWKRMV